MDDLQKLARRYDVTDFDEFLNWRGLRHAGVFERESAVSGFVTEGGWLASVFQLVNGI